MNSIDIIGDIHGQADKLKALLVSLGYKNTQGAWRHPARTALFVGDFVDRGPGQLEVLDIARRMVDTGSAQAVMGNHEFNAIAFYLLDPENPSQHLRVRSAKNRHQHQRFLDEVGEDTPLHKEWVEWFKTLPLWIDAPHFRAVHACWHPEFISELNLVMPNQLVTDDLVMRASRKGSSLYEQVEALCKGMEVDLPEGVSYQDAEGTVRTRTRTRWWDETAKTYQAGALLPRMEQDQLPNTDMPGNVCLQYDNEKPLFFGHYWMTGQPLILSEKICCVDYSAAKNGPLVAYRWDGEDVLSSDKLIGIGGVSAPKMRA